MLVYEHLKMTSMFINSSFKVVVNVIMFLCVVTWLTCIQNVGELKRLGECLTSSTFFTMVFVLDYITNLLTMSQNFNRIRVKIIKQCVRAKSMGFKV
jgi:hypothetical protein